MKTNTDSHIFDGTKQGEKRDKNRTTEKTVFPRKTKGFHKRKAQ